MTTKICSKCGEEYDISHFSWSIKGVKRHAKCLKCRSEERIAYYQEHKEEELAYKYERQKERRDVARRFVTDYLRTHPCEGILPNGERCRESDIYVLTFHHVRGAKKMDISQMVNQGYSIEVLQAEISKTIVLCFNCHMREEKQRRGTRYD